MTPSVRNGLFGLLFITIPLAACAQQAAPAQGEDGNMHVLGLKGRWGKRKALLL